MRIFENSYELISEVLRDLHEMGKIVKPKSYQNKVIEGNPDFFTKEINNYHYRLLGLGDVEPLFSFSQPGSRDWVLEEFEERIASRFVNPGVAWVIRQSEWEQFLNEDGEMDYTYNERLKGLERIIFELKRNPDTRQAWLPIFERKDIENLGGSKRVPCSLGYNFSVREGQLNLTYIQRSADAVAHFGNDIILAHFMLQYVVSRLKVEGLEVEAGYLDHFIFSLHAYQKDWETLEAGISKL